MKMLLPIGSVTVSARRSPAALRVSAAIIPKGREKGSDSLPLTPYVFWLLSILSYRGACHFHQN